MNKFKLRYLIITVIFVLLIFSGWTARFLVIDAFYKSDPKTFDLKTFKSGKVKILQSGDTIRGKKSPQSKVFVSIFPFAKRQEVSVGKDGQWLYKIGNVKKNSKYSLIVQYYDKEYTPEKTKSYRIKIVKNRKFYKNMKSIMKNLKKQNSYLYPLFRNYILELPNEEG